MFANNDLTLTHDNIKQCLDTIDFDGYDVVYTHSGYDMHFEHKLVAAQVLVCCRPNSSSVRELYTAASFTSAQVFGQSGRAFSPNTFIDVEKHIAAKKKALEHYSMEFPKSGNDIRSIDNIIDWNRHNGKIVNLKCVEPYEQVFKIG